MGATFVAYQYLQNWADSPLLGERDTVLYVARGETLVNISTQLVQSSRMSERDLSLRLFQLLGRIEGIATRIKVGEYALPAEITPREVLDKVVRGDVVQHAFRIHEGETVAQMLQRMRGNERIDHTLLATSPSALRLELGLETPFAEGMFFPDTYLFAAGDSDRALLLRAHRAMRQELAAVWESRAEHAASSEALEAVNLDDAFQLLILASIIEKETGREEDRAQISQVFHKRLRDRMRLQTDPTVIYAAGASYAGDITREHLGIDSPFNTYRYRGLPPTPIAMPSLASLQAAAHPAEGDYVYFVARGDGTSKFSRTLKEHNAAVRKYQLSR